MISNAAGSIDLGEENGTLRLVHVRPPINRPLWIGAILFLAACAIGAMWKHDPSLPDSFFQGTTFVAVAALALITWLLVSPYAAGATTATSFDNGARTVRIETIRRTGPPAPRVIPFDQVRELRVVEQTRGVVRIETLMLIPTEGKSAMLAQFQGDTRVMRDTSEPGLAAIADKIAAQTALPRSIQLPGLVAAAGTALGIRRK